MEDFKQYLRELERKIAEDLKTALVNRTENVKGRFHAIGLGIERRIAEDFEVHLGKLNGRLRKIST